MDRFFDRLGDLLRAFLHEDSATRRRRPNPYSDYDPDMRDAWEELDDYLRGETPRQRTSRAEAGFTGLSEREHLRQDYTNLEVPFGAPFEQVKKSHRRLMAQYHPDRNSGDPRRLKMATEISQKINASFQRIKEFENSKSGRRQD